MLCQAKKFKRFLLTALKQNLIAVWAAINHIGCHSVSCLNTRWLFQLQRLLIPTARIKFRQKSLKILLSIKFEGVTNLFSYFWFILFTSYIRHCIRPVNETTIITSNISKNNKKDYVELNEIWWRSFNVFGIACITVEFVYD